MSRAAIFYTPEAFTLPAARIFGRQAAGASFLRGYLRHCGSDRLTAFVRDSGDGALFVDAVRALKPAVEAVWAPPWRLQPLEAAGVLFVFEPRLAEHAWRRRGVGAERYSLCGLTHTIASHAAMDSIAELLVAPLHAWDALICTSRAVRSAVETILEAQASYLVERFGPRLPAAPQLPVLPLGIDTAAFAPELEDRGAFRRRLGLTAEALVVISLGRQSLHAKANPLPLFMALERAAEAAGVRPHLVLAGWFPDESQERTFRAQASALAPSVGLHLVEVQGPGPVREALAGSDIAVAFIDNIQETFGLATVEAMAAALPVVVSDWDGLRDTVEHGVEGFRIPTTLAPGGAGGDLALRYGAGVDNFDGYVGGVSQFAAFDVGEAAEALTALLSDEALRKRMGAAGAAKARRQFDWSIVIPEYQALWAELNARRKADAPGTFSAAQPSRLDPFTIFEGYPTRILSRSDRIRLGDSSGALGGAAGLLDNPGAALLPQLLLAREDLEAVLDFITRAESATVEEALQALAPGRRVLAFRALVWLAKFDLIRIS